MRLVQEREWRRSWDASKTAGKINYLCSACLQKGGKPHLGLLALRNALLIGGSSGYPQDIQKSGRNLICESEKGKKDSNDVG